MVTRQKKCIQTLYKSKIFQCWIDYLSKKYLSIFVTNLWSNILDISWIQNNLHMYTRAHYHADSFGRTYSIQYMHVQYMCISTYILYTYMYIMKNTAIDKTFMDKSFWQLCNYEIYRFRISKCIIFLSKNQRVFWLPGMTHSTGWWHHQFEILNKHAYIHLQMHYILVLL